MDHKKRLAHAIVKYLKNEASTGQFSEDVTESLDVAIQCLEQAFSVDSSSTSPENDCGKSLLDIFIEGTKAPEISEASKVDAEELKLKGNELMKNGSYQEAVTSYTKAIEIDPENSIYYSNRAAAYTKLAKHDEAIRDCKAAVKIDPQFSRAYGRMGLAQMNKEQFEDARQSYKKALSLDPENSGYKKNLELVEQKIAEKRGPPPGASPGGFPNLGGLDIGSLLSNPAVMNLAQNFMQNPQMQQMFSGMMGGAVPEGAPETGGQNQGQNRGQNQGQNAPSINMQDILGATQNFAQQLHQDNPELVEQLRNQFRGNNPDENKQDE